MAKWSFIKCNETQAIVEIETALHKEELLVSVDKDNSKINLAIEVGEVDKGSFQLDFDTTQKLFLWLKSKGAILDAD